MAPPPVTSVSWALTRKSGRRRAGWRETLSSNYDSQKAAGCPQSARAYSDSRARGRGVLVDLTREHAAGGRRGLAPVVAVAPFMSSSLHPPSDHDRYVVPVRYSLSAPPCAQLWRHASPRTTGTPRCLLPTPGANCQWQRGRVPVAGLPVPAVLRDSVCCYKLPPHSRFDRLPAATVWRGNPVCASAPLQVKPRPAVRRRARRPPDVRAPRGGLSGLLGFCPSA